MTGPAVRQAGIADLPALLRLWRQNDELHAALQPGFFRQPPSSSSSPWGAEGALRSEQALLRALMRSDERVLVALGAPGSGAPADWPLPERGSARVCGVLHVRIYDTPAAPTLMARRRAHVADLVVAAWARRRGHGRRLMAEGAAWARGRGAEQVVLTVWAGNREAEAFYRALGYEPVSQVMAQDLPR